VTWRPQLWNHCCVEACKVDFTFCFRFKFVCYWCKNVHRMNGHNLVLFLNARFHRCVYSKICSRLILDIECEVRFTFFSPQYIHPELLFSPIVPPHWLFFFTYFTYINLCFYLCSFLQNIVPIFQLNLAILGMRLCCWSSKSKDWYMTLYQLLIAPVENSTVTHIILFLAFWYFQSFNWFCIVAFTTHVYFHLIFIYV